MLVLKDDEGFKRCFYFFGGGVLVCKSSLTLNTSLNLSLDIKF